MNICRHAHKGVSHFKECLCGRETGLSDDLKSLLQELTHLNRQEYAKVTLKSRQVDYFCFIDLLFLS